MVSYRLLNMVIFHMYQGLRPEIDTHLKSALVKLIIVTYLFNL